jgi:serine protease Do
MNNNRKLKIKKMMKKGATISLCAVLAGGIGVGAYEGINYFSGAQSVQAATDSSENLTLMKSDKRQQRYRGYKILRYKGQSGCIRCC